MIIEKEDKSAFNKVTVGDSIFQVLKVSDYEELNLTRVITGDYISKKWGILELNVVEKKDGTLKCKSPQNPSLVIYVESNDHPFFSLQAARKAVKDSEKKLNDFFTSKNIETDAEDLSKELREAFKILQHGFSDLVNEYKEKRCD
jgi:hypothetical protein